MNSTENPRTDFVPLATVAARFAYRDAEHFLAVAAPRLALRPVKVGTRWVFDSAEVEAALTRLKSPATLTPAS